jgi:hypothetical protein
MDGAGEGRSRWVEAWDRSLYDSLHYWITEW